jgi:hypothetical protein
VRLGKARPRVEIDVRDRGEEVEEAGQQAVAVVARALGELQRHGRLVPDDEGLRQRPLELAAADGPRLELDRPRQVRERGIEIAAREQRLAVEREIAGAPLELLPGICR